jgi:hypothetical protein
MGYSKSQKTRTDKSIVSRASKRLREKGSQDSDGRANEGIRSYGRRVLHASIGVTIWLPKRLARPSAAGKVEWTLP